MSGVAYLVTLFEACSSNCNHCGCTHATTECMVLRSYSAVARLLTPDFSDLRTLDLTNHLIFRTVTEESAPSPEDNSGGEVA